MTIFLTKIYNQLSIKKIIYLFVLLSFFVAWRVVYIQHGWVNNDFVLYHESARLFSLGEWKEAIQVYSWPLYSILIAVLHRLLGVDLHLAAQILSVLFFVITTYAFLTIISKANGDKLTVACGALILFGASYLVGDVFPMLLRDPGAWAFFLLSMAFIIQFYREVSWKSAVAWQVFAGISMLFRVEYITFLVLMPLVIFFKQDISISQKVRMWLKAQSLLITFVIGLIILLSVSPSLNIENFGRLREIADIFGNRYKVTVDILTKKSEVLGIQVLNDDWGGYVTIALAMTFIGLSLIKCLGSLGWVNSFLLFCSRNKTLHISCDAKRILIFSVYLSLLNIFVIVFSVFLLTGRYTAPLVLSFMVLTSFSLAYFIKRSFNSKEIWKLLFVAVVLLFMVFGIIGNLWVRPAGSNYQQDAVVWLKKNNVDKNQVFFDNARTRYYAGASFQGIIDKRGAYLEDSIKSRDIEHYEYLLINLSQSRPEREAMIANALPEYKMVQRFYGVKNKKSVAIYKKDSK